MNRMMKIFKHILYVTVMILFVGCQDDFLDRPPLDKIATDSYWKTPSDLENYVLQFYPKLPSHGSNAGMPKEDASSDNLVLAVANSVLNGERAITTGGWQGDWDEIRSINIFFDNYQKVTGDLNTYAHYLGEAHFSELGFILT